MQKHASTRVRLVVNSWTYLHKQEKVGVLRLGRLPGSLLDVLFWGCVRKRGQWGLVGSKAVGLLTDLVPKEGKEGKGG